MAVVTRPGPVPELSLRSNDLDETREIATRVLHPHRLTVIGDPTRYGINLHMVSLGVLDLGWLHYDTAVRIESDHPGSYQVNVAAAGRMVATCGDQEVVAGAGLATIYNPDRPAAFTVPAPVLALRISRQALDHELEQLLDRPVRRSPTFALGMDVATGRGARWLALAQSLSGTLSDENAPIRQPMVAAPFAHDVVAGLLLASRHEYSDELAAPVPPVSTPAVRTAQAFIEANAARPLTVVDIARATGVGVRALQHGFQRTLNMSPMRYLREIRLREAHRELRAADSSAADIATRWGFHRPRGAYRT
ncbi:AraC family transcriptional regulator [Actinophytocola oryzae]|uniref:AraC family transcriptional regulator n=1 Tax=Actinophytocola oryzae TaxID=502181 RepID=A0A4R7V4G2_9PSEU|nr:AraC family transcriptional regulator [Actinophytocola oryzae]TDV43562.1 AraC family transcriptional regulator [Actinophytocola oryzae]